METFWLHILKLIISVWWLTADGASFLVTAIATSVTAGADDSRRPAVAIGASEGAEVKLGGGRSPAGGGCLITAVGARDVGVAELVSGQAETLGTPHGPGWASWSDDIRLSLQPTKMHRERNISLLVVQIIIMIYSLSSFWSRKGVRLGVYPLEFNHLNSLLNIFVTLEDRPHLTATLELLYPVWPIFCEWHIF